MRALVAWRVLTHEVARSSLAVLGVFAAIVLVFLQLGFYSSVPIGSMFIYEALKFDIALTSRDYAFQIRSHYFPRRRLYQALAHPDVASGVPFYQNFARWLNAERRMQREVFIMGVDPDKDVFAVPEIGRQVERLRGRDTILIDRATHEDFGPRVVGTEIEINERKITAVGEYSLGTGFLGLGVAVVSDLNFIRLFPRSSLDDVSVGLVRLKPGADAKAVARALSAEMPADTRVFTRAEFAAHEQDYWLNATSTGLVFGFGAVVAALVGGVILFQTLSTLIMRNLPEYAVLKAIGHSNRYLTEIVIFQAVLIVLVASGPAVGAAYGLYDVTRSATNLPVYMTGERIAAVLFATMVAAVAGGMITNRILKRADPVDLF